MIYVISANKMFECSGTLFGGGFDFLGGDGREGNALCGIIVECQVVVYTFDGRNQRYHRRRHFS